MNLANRIVEALGAVLPCDRFTPLHEPFFKGREWDYVRECIDTNWVSTAGKFVERFEEGLVAVTGANRAVAVNSGTAALQLALQVCGVKQGDEVVVPSLTFAATAAAAVHAGGSLLFADIDRQTLGLNPDKLDQELQLIAIPGEGGPINKQTGRRIAAVVPVHIFGHMVCMNELSAVCAKWNLPIVEDAAEALGSTFKGAAAGTIGVAGILSFNGNKIITAGGGGAILTNDEELANKARHLSSTAKLPHSWEYSHDLIGYNYRLPNINAALATAQLEQLNTYIKRKRKLAYRYAELFANFDEVSFIEEPDGCMSNYWLNTIMLEGDAVKEREAILQATNKAGFMTRPAWNLLHTLSPYAKYPTMDLSTALEIAPRLINIPSGAGIVVA